jgi:hypothetical protein
VSLLGERFGSEETLGAVMLLVVVYLAWRI